MDMPCLSDGLLRDVFSTMGGQNSDQVSVLQNKEAPEEGHRHDYHETPCSTSQYTLDMIFNNLIYPDVSEGQSITYDTLLQTVSETCNSTSDLLCSWLPQTQVGDLSVPEKRGTFSGKRKRSDQTSCVDDAQKRLRCKTTSNGADEPTQAVSNAATSDRRKLVPRRVREYRR
ncbi:uncharacterized protein [Haliotis asinina]|uniref:uncharacterized protein n=1 Tax=Haliotis asinina TaxID=109174 RepID=UPI00353254AF